ncbi:MAG: nicotinate phosphoribosyltransferase, partial [Acutalibacteraceae bacterium]
PVYTWKRKTVTNFVSKPLLVKMFENGKKIYDCPEIEDSRTYCRKQVDETLWDEIKRFENPHKYYVDLSQALWNEKDKLLKAHAGK